MKRCFRILAIWALALAGFLSGAMAVQGPSSQPQSPMRRFVKGRIIVKYKSQAGSAAAKHYEKGGKFKDFLGSDSLDRIHDKFKVKSGKRAFSGLNHKMKQGKTEADVVRDTKD